MKNENIIFHTTDPFNRPVTLLKSTWNGHITEGHPEMTGNELAVQNTVERPEFIYQSTWNPKAEVFFSRSTESTYPELYTRVIVGYNGDNEGNIETALFSKSVASVKEGGLLYVKPKH